MENKVPTLYILIGIPGSGKSRWAIGHPQYYRICPDEVRLEQFDDMMDQKNNINAHLIVRGMLITALKFGIDTVLDGTNLNTKFRREMFAKLPFHKRCAKIFDIDPDIAFKRMKKDIENGVFRADVPKSTFYRYYGDFLYCKEAVEKEEFDSIDYVDQDSF